MSVRKQIARLWELYKRYSIYEETPEAYLHETDVDSLFYQQLFDIFQSQQRRDSNRKSFAIKLLQFCDLKTQQRYIFEEGVNVSKRELTSLAENLRHFIKIFNHASKCIQIPLPKPKVETGSTKSKDNLFAYYYNYIIEHPNRQIRLSFRFGNNNSCISSIKSLSYTAINLFSQNLSILTIANFTTSTRTDLML